MKVPISETGTASNGIKVARQPCRKMIDHEDHQCDRFQQRLADLFHAFGDRQRGVERDYIVETLREPLFASSINFRTPSAVERVGSGQLVDGEQRGRLAVEAAVKAVGLRAQFDSRDVFQPQHAAVGWRAP